MTYKRKRYIVDRKFQLGMTFTVIGTTFLVICVLSLLIPYNALRTNEKMSRVIDHQDKIMQALVSHTVTLDSKMKSAESELAAVKAEKARIEAKKEDKAEGKAADKAAEKQEKKAVVKKKAVPSDEITVPDIREEKPEIEIGKIARTHLDNIGELRDMVSFNTKLLWSVVILILAQGIILFFILILKTHRIAGPVYVMSGYIREIISGKIPASLRPLRKHDDLKNLYSLFVQMVDTLKSGKKLTVSKAVAPKAVAKSKPAKTAKKPIRKIK